MFTLLSVREVANELGYSGATIRRWISSGILDHVRFSQRNIRIPRESVDRLKEIGRRMAEQANQPTIKPTALATNNPTLSGISKLN